VLAGNLVEAYGAAQAPASGAVLAVVSVSIIPHAFMQVSSIAAAAVLGFIAAPLSADPSGHVDPVAVEPGHRPGFAGVALDGRPGRRRHGAEHARPDAQDAGRVQ
jgi:hypothetical protein